MATFSSRIEDEEYVNWLKVGLALNYLREGLRVFVETEGKALQSSIAASVFGNTSGPHNSCNTCTKDHCCRRKREDVWKINSCPNQVCDKFLAGIMQNYTQTKNIPKPTTDPKDWQVDFFSIIQLYFGPGGGNKQTIEDCDCPNFLNLFINCKWYNNCNTRTDLALRALDILKHRNNLMHSTSLKIPTATMKVNLDGMISMLESLKDFNSRQEAVHSVNSIKEIRDTSLQITQKAEIQILQQHMLDMQKRMKESNCVVEELSETCQDLSLDFQQLRSGDIQPLSINVQNIAQKYETACKKVQKVTTHVQNQAAESAKLKRALIGQRNLLDRSTDLQSDMETRFVEVRRQYEFLSDRIDHAESELARCTSWKGKLANLEKKVQDSESSLNRLEERMNETESTIGQLGTRVDDKESTFRKLLAKAGEYEYLPSVSETFEDLHATL